jgi:Predicted membrane protein (DUF2306)
MTQLANTDTLPREPGEPDPGETVYQEPVTRRPWWRRSAFVALWIVALGFILYAVPPYLTLDPATALIPRLRQDLPLHYVMLVGHVWFGALTLVTVCIQIVPWVRKRYPAVHRWSGRVYVFFGVLPSGLFALGITPFSAGPPGNAIAALLWLAATIAGFRAARQGRLAAHRLWMIYSVALTFQIVWGRVLLLVLPLLGVDFSDEHTLNLALETATWIGFVINLLAAHFWIEYTAWRATRNRRISPTTQALLN